MKKSKYEAIIVDDEMNIREMLLSIGDWAKYGIEVVGLAKDGKEALDLMNHHSPDLIILDMNMPRMSGTDLISTIQKRNIDVKIIVLSGYEEFTYAKASLSGGAIAYLLKPLDRNELCRALEKFVQQKEREGYITTGKQSLDNSVNTRIAYCLNTKGREAMLEQLLKGIGLNACEVLAFSIRKNDESDYGRQPATKEMPVRLVCIHKEYNLFCAIFPRGGKGSLEDWLYLTKREYGQDLYGGEIIHCDSAENLTDGYKKSLNRLYNENLFTLRALERDNGHFVEAEGLHKSLKELKDSIQMGRPGVIKHLFDDFIGVIIQNKNLCVAPVLKFCKQVSSVVESIWWNNGFDKELPDITKYMEDIRFSFSDIILFEALEKIAHAYQSFIEESEKSFIKNKIEVIREYIDDNIEKSMTLQSISEVFFLNKEYISRAFKSKYDINITSYIHQRKCLKASQLLRHSSVNSVAAQLGYDDISYFSRIFKKYMHLSPGEYRTKTISEE